jgi:hypothetical protein
MQLICYLHALLIYSILKSEFVVKVLKRSARNFEIFSNIKLIVLKNTLRRPLYGTTNEKNLSRLVCPQKNHKVGD